MRIKNFKKKLMLLFVLLCMSVFTTTCTLKVADVIPGVSSKLSVQFLDVGQGDCIFVKLPDGQSMLIDAGNNADGEKIVEFIKNQGTEKIDFLIGTHPHADHIGGMDDVINQFEVGKIYMPAVTANTRTFEEVLEAIKNKGLKIDTVKAGVVVLDGDVKAEFISPAGESYEEINDYSAVLKLTYGEKTFLFAGDSEYAAEKEMLESYEIDSDVLKVAHHGSSSSTHKAFLGAVSPEYAIISVGEGNDYGHPHKNLIKRLEDIDTTVFRTDLNGTITMICDGKTIDVTSER